MTVDASGKAAPPSSASVVRQDEPPPTPKTTAQGENVADIEARVNAGEVINLTDLSAAIKKDKQAAQSKQSGKSATKTTAAKSGNRKTTQTQSSAAKKTKEEKPSIRAELAESKRQAAAQNSPAQTKTKELEV